MRSYVVLTVAVSSRCLCLWFSHKHKIPGQQTLHWTPIPCNGPSPHPVTMGISVGIDIHGSRSRTLPDDLPLAISQKKIRFRLFTCPQGQRWLCSTLWNTWVLRSEYTEAPVSMIQLFWWVNPARQVRVRQSRTRVPRVLCPGQGLHTWNDINWTCESCLLVAAAWISTLVASRLGRSAGHWHLFWKKELVTRGWQHGICACECTCLECTCCTGMWKGECVPSPMLSSYSHFWHNIWSKFFFTIHVPAGPPPFMVAILKTTSAFWPGLKSLQLVVSVGGGLGHQHSWTFDWALF